MSETAMCRERVKNYCKGLGLDIGFGGDPVVETAICFDLPRPYTNVGDKPQHIAGDCRDLSMFSDNSLDYIYSSHLIEDFTYEDCKKITYEWRCKIKYGGHLILYCPDQQVYVAHCERTGQPYNHAHKEPDFSLVTFMEKGLAMPTLWDVVRKYELVETYSWELILRKI